MGLHFFEFELKPTGKDCADATQHEFWLGRIHLKHRSSPPKKKDKTERHLVPVYSFSFDLK